MNNNASEKPGIITFFGFFLLIGGIGSLSVGVSRIIDLPIIGVVYILQAICIFIIFIGLMAGKKWSLKVIIVLLGYSFVLGSWESINETSYVFLINVIGSSIVLLILIYLLTRPNVKAYFEEDK